MRWKEKTPLTMEMLLIGNIDASVDFTAVTLILISADSLHPAIVVYTHH